jgi:hypothetical protein
MTTDTVWFHAAKCGTRENASFGRNEQKITITRPRKTEHFEDNTHYEYAIVNISTFHVSSFSNVQL